MKNLSNLATRRTPAYHSALTPKRSDNSYNSLTPKKLSTCETLIIISSFFKYSFLFIHQHLPVLRHAFHADIHLLARGIVEELHLGFALCIGGDVGLPPDGAAEVRHGRYHAIVLRLECGGLVEALEVGAAEAFVALRRE